MAVSHVGWKAGTATGSPVIEMRIETVDVATGFPSGTLWAASTSKQGTITTNAWTLQALDAVANISRGQFFAVKHLYISGTSCVGQVWSSMSTSHLSFPYNVTNTSGSDVQNRINGSLLAIGSGATSFYAVSSCWPVSTAATNTSFNNTDGHMRGILFRPPFSARMEGVRHYPTSARVDYNLKLLAGGTDEVLASIAVNGLFNANIDDACQEFYLTQPYDVSANTAYRLVSEPTTGSGTTCPFGVCVSSDYIPALPWGGRSMLTERSSGVWTDTPTSFAFIDGIFSALEDGSIPTVASGVFGGDVQLIRQHRYIDA